MAEPVRRELDTELVEYAQRRAHEIDDDYMLVYGLLTTLGVESIIMAVFFCFL